MRGTAAMIAILILTHVVTPAASALAQAAEPFPEVRLPQASGRSHRWAYATMLAGAGLATASFVLQDHADDAYNHYLRSTDPDEIVELYDRAHYYDQLSTATLVSGELLIAAGLWMRFLKRGTSDRLAMEWRPNRCALSLRF